MFRRMLVVFVVFISIFAVFKGVQGQEIESFNQTIFPCGYGTIDCINSVNHSVVYNGSELIMRIDLYRNLSILYVEAVGNFTHSIIYYPVSTFNNSTMYIFKLNFETDGLASFIMYLSDGSSERVLFDVASTNYTYVEEYLFEMYNSEWLYGVSETNEISDLMAATYEDTPAGHHAAVLDTIDDSTALRKGPYLFGYFMGTGLATITIYPYATIWLFIIFVLIMFYRRNEALALKKMDEEREGLDLDTSKLAIAAKLSAARERSTLISIKNIAPHLGISRVVWRDIHKQYSSVGALQASFDESKFLEDGRIEGPIADALTTWIRNSLTLDQRAKVAGDYRTPTVRDYVEALKRILHYVSVELHFINYEIYIKRLNESEKWLDEIVKSLRPTGAAVFEKPVKGELDFTNMSSVLK